MKLKLPPPLQALIIAGAMWAVASQVDHLNISFAGQTWIGYGIMLFGFSLDLACALLFVKAKTTISPLSPDKSSQLVTTGLYQYSRNPMYLGVLIILVGYMIKLGNPLNLILILCFIASMTILQIKPEEEILRAKFGKAYEEYCKKVRRWI